MLDGGLAMGNRSLHIGKFWVIEFAIHWIFAFILPSAERMIIIASPSIFEFIAVIDVPAEGLLVSHLPNYYKNN